MTKCEECGKPVSVRRKSALCKNCLSENEEYFLEMREESEGTSYTPSDGDCGYELHYY